MVICSYPGHTIAYMKNVHAFEIMEAVHIRRWKIEIVGDRIISPSNNVCFLKMAARIFAVGNNNTFSFSFYCYFQKSSKIFPRQGWGKIWTNQVSLKGWHLWRFVCNHNDTRHIWWHIFCYYSTSSFTRNPLTYLIQMRHNTYQACQKKN